MDNIEKLRNQWPRPESGFSPLDIRALRIAMNTARTYKPKRSRPTRACQANGLNVPRSQGEGLSAEQIVDDYCRSLPPEERGIFTLYLLNLTDQEIADVIGISEPAVWKIICGLKYQFKQQHP